MPVEALQQLLGSDFAIGAANPAQQHEIWPEESGAISKSIDKRRREFSAGRAAARIALGKLGQLPQPIPQGKQRAPQWPAGFTGSISHCEGHALAAVAQATTCRSVGIDVEPAKPLKAGLDRLICTAEERAWIAKQDQPDRDLWGTVIFSAKEAVYKAQYPLTEMVIGFDEVTLAIVPEDNSFSIGFKTLNTPDLPQTGRYCFGGGVILAAVRT